ncbi:MAG: hypothetical protein ACYCWW_02085 [Deltaproteobacteria bacterium]
MHAEEISFDPPFTVVSSGLGNPDRLRSWALGSAFAAQLIVVACQFPSTPVMAKLMSSFFLAMLALIVGGGVAESGAQGRLVDLAQFAVAAAVIFFDVAATHSGLPIFAAIVPLSLWAGAVAQEARQPAPVTSASAPRSAHEWRRMDVDEFIREFGG